MNFVLIYIAEAHPGSIVSLAGPAGQRELQIVPPASFAQARLQNLHALRRAVGLTMPAVIDDEDDSARRAYAAWPDRLYVVGANGRIQYKGEPGPVGFKVRELENWLKDNVR